VTPEEAAAVLSVFERADDYESLMWRVDMSADSRDVKLFALCNDLFHWATADCEEIAAGDVPLLESCLTDLRATKEDWYFAELFAARKRGLRPQKPFYKEMNAATAALFDACSTEAERTQADKRDAAFWSNVAAKVATARERDEGGDAL
jgi:hypothetical protein